MNEYVVALKSSHIPICLMCFVYLKLLAYAHDRRKVVLRGGRDLLTGRSDVLDGVVKVTQLCCDGPLVHCTNHKKRYEGGDRSEEHTVYIILYKLAFHRMQWLHPASKWFSGRKVASKTSVVVTSQYLWLPEAPLSGLWKSWAAQESVGTETWPVCGERWISRLLFWLCLAARKAEIIRD